MKKFIPIICMFIFLLSGCAPSGIDMFFKGERIQIPQIAANIEPAIKNNKIYISGNMIIKNPTESDIELGKTIIEIRDEKDSVFEKILLEWKEPEVRSKNVLESPVEIDIDLSMLKKESMEVFLKTEIIYKDLKIRIPIENRLAVFHFDLLRENIIRPLHTIIYTTLRSDITGDSYLDFVLDITNPTGADLLLANGTVEIYTEEEGTIAKTNLKDTLFKAGERNQIEGTLETGNIFGSVISNRFLSKYPLRIKFTGGLAIPETNIAMPFNIESVQRIDFSLLPRESS